MQPFCGAGPGAGLTKPLWDLLVALDSINRGIAHPLLTPPKPGKKVKSLERIALEQWCVIYCDTLKRSGASTVEASAIVARELSEVKLTNGPVNSTPTANTVKNWYNKTVAAEGKTREETEWRRYLDIVTENPGVTSDTWKSWALDKLRGVIANRLILQSPPVKVAD